MGSLEWLREVAVEQELAAEQQVLTWLFLVLVGVDWAAK